MTLIATHLEHRKLSFQLIGSCSVACEPRFNVPFLKIFAGQQSRQKLKLPEQRGATDQLDRSNFFFPEPEIDGAANALGGPGNPKVVPRERNQVTQFLHTIYAPGMPTDWWGEYLFRRSTDC